MDDYTLVSCDFHDELEALATLQKPCHIEYRDQDGKAIAADDVIVDIYSENKADYLKLKNGTIIRMDQLIKVDGKPVSFAQNSQC